MTRAPSRGDSPLTVAVMIETDGPGGAELVVYQLCLELRARGHKVIAVGPEHGEGWLSARLSTSGIDRQTFSLRRPLDGLALRNMIRMLKRVGVQAVHSHEFTMAVYGCAAARWLGIPHVITMHGDQGVTAAWKRRAALRWAIRRSHAAVAVSDHTRQSMEERLRLPDRTMRVVHNGIPVPTGDRDAARGRLRLCDAIVLVLAVGSLRPNKGHHILIEALGRVAAQPDLPAWRLAIAGQGEQLEILQRASKQFGVSDRVDLLGQREDIADLHAAADIFAMPSYSEGLPLAVLEAMFAGSAIVASRVGGIPEAIEDGEEGLLVPPGDPAALAEALSRLIATGSLRRRLGDAARSRAHSEFRIERMVERYEPLYQGRGGEPSR